MDALRLTKVKALPIGAGIDALLNQLYHLLENPILMHDMDYKLISYAKDAVTDDPLWNILLTEKCFSPQDIQFFKNEGFIDEVANSQVVSFLTTEHLPYDRYVGKIFSVDNISIANVILIGSDRPFHDGDALLFEAACEMITKEISNIEFYRQYAQSYQDMLIATLIGNGIQDKALYAGHMANVYGDFNDHLYLGVARPDQSTDLLALRSLLMEALPELKFSVYQDHIVMLLNSNYTHLQIDRDLPVLHQLFHQHGLKGGFSAPFDNVYQLSIYYKQACEMLTQARAPGQRMFLYNKVPDPVPQ